MRRPARAPLAGDFTRAIVAIKNPSGLTWEELARLPGTNTLNLWRWRKGVRPDTDRLLLLHTPSRAASASNTSAPWSQGVIAAPRRGMKVHDELDGVDLLYTSSPLLWM